MLPELFMLNSERDQEPGGLLSKRALSFEGYNVTVRAGTPGHSTAGGKWCSWLKGILHCLTDGQKCIFKLKNYSAADFPWTSGSLTSQSSTVVSRFSLFSWLISTLCDQNMGGKWKGIFLKEQLGSGKVRLKQALKYKEMSWLKSFSCKPDRISKHRN